MVQTWNKLFAIWNLELVKILCHEQLNDLHAKAPFETLLSIIVRIYVDMNSVLSIYVCTKNLFGKPLVSTALTLYGKVRGNQKCILVHIIGQKGVFFLSLSIR